ncbi:hypothetical protein [Thermosipho sp. 1074]|uniref:hypothetical protein n=1 Tax=Thermosipho sp. 1074 TaxID=1643331 RepID=UPI00098429BD|nr:hypothetical protein [Thermosipho sp. 1074]OOC42166.1 hypothetical protein XO08_07730 [Thermosipho sp. 1074]
MDLFKLLHEYFNTKLENISNKYNISLETVKVCFFEGFIEGYSFDDNITVNLRREVTQFSSKTKEIPVLLKEFIEHELDNSK